MININHVVISGRATADSILAYTENGRAYLKFRFAANQNYKNKSGEWKQTTTFASATLWGTSAERLCERIKKGTPLIIEGSLSSYTKEGEDGIKRTTLSINAFRAQILNTKTQEPQEVEEEVTINVDADGPVEEDVPFDEDG